MNLYINILAIISISTLAITAEAKIIFGRYNVGLSYAASTSYAAISYDATRSPELPDGCEATDGSTTDMTCTAFLAPDGDGSPSLGVFIEKPFKREGWFYFEPGFSVSTITYTGHLTPTRPDTPFKNYESKADSAEAPLTHATIFMYGINWRTYLKLGLTPRYIPDLFVSGGVGLQTVAGNVRVFKSRTNTTVAQADGFVEFELVALRFGDGSLSAYYSLDQTLASPYSSKLIQDKPSGTETKNYSLGLKETAAGIRLLMPF